MNECTRCNGTGLIKWIQIINGKEEYKTIVCHECNGYGELEDVCK